MAVFREKNWGGFWRVLAPKVAVSDFEVLKTLVLCTLVAILSASKARRSSNAICMYIGYIYVYMNKAS